MSTFLVNSSDPALFFPSLNHDCYNMYLRTAIMNKIIKGRYLFSPFLIFTKAINDLFGHLGAAQQRVSYSVCIKVTDADWEDSFIPSLIRWWRWSQKQIDVRVKG